MLNNVISIRVVNNNYFDGMYRVAGYDNCWYKLYWVGCEEGMSGFGILAAEKLINHVIEVR